jgi:hypothetical protein
LRRGSWGLAVAVPGGDPGHFLWGTGPLGRNSEAQVLRGLVKHAELAETDADRLAVVRARIQVLQGDAAVLEIAVGRTPDRAVGGWRGICAKWRLVQESLNARQGTGNRRWLGEMLGAPTRIRTGDTRFRKPLLYPLSYGG